jgi:hypothetical protein
MHPDAIQTLNLIATVAGFALTAARVGALLATISAKLDGVACDVARVARDVERLQQVVQVHGEDIAMLKSTNVTLRPAAIGR